MLTHLAISHFVTISKLVLDCEQGLTVITGETGAGKSILMDALGILTGARAQPSMIREGETQAELSAHFEIKDKSAADAWLKAQSYNDGSDCIIRRVIKKDGRSKIYINGHLATLQELKTLSQWLLTIHGQHASHALTQLDIQRDLLDTFADLKPLRQEVQNAFSSFSAAQKKLAELLEITQKQDDKKALLTYQLKEFLAATLDSEELETIEAKHKEMASAESAVLSLNEVHGKISDDRGILDEMHACIQRIESLTPNIKHLTTANDLLKEAQTLISEVVGHIDDAAKRLQFTPEAFHVIESRLSELHQLARKHQTKIPQLTEHQEALQQEINTLSHLDEEVESAHVLLAQAKQDLNDLALSLSKKRQLAAKKLSKKITPILHQLNMPHAVFEVDISPIDATCHGIDKINYLIQTNLGQKLEPLGQVASGGELSRASLAIEILTHAQSATPIIIFDEVDVGISGETAITVGKLLRELASRCQVLCITHLPQVAAFGQQHWQVIKSYQNEQTFSSVDVLNKSQREVALATLIAGKVDTSSKKTAKKMLDECC